MMMWFELCLAAQSLISRGLNTQCWGACSQLGGAADVAPDPDWLRSPSQEVQDTAAERGAQNQQSQLPS